MKELESRSQEPEDKVAWSVQNISYPATRLTSWPVIRYKIQDKTVG